VDGHDESDVLEEITRGGLPSNVRAELVADDPPPVLFELEDAGCPVFYAAGGKVFPERCQLEAGHKPRTQIANHYHGAIGWWA
jgi:hypothetical protein